MKVLFIYSLADVLSATKPLQTLEEIQFGISYISSFLKKHGHHTRLIVLNRILVKKNKNIIDEYFKKFYPDLICFTAVATEYHFIAEAAKYIKNRYPDIYLLIGGPHASLSPEEVLLDDFDAICIGEGEYPVLELVSQLEEGAVPSDISNLWIKHGPEVEKNPTRPFLQDLDNLPFPDREMWLEWIDEKPASMPRCSVLLGRGCPFQCSYCSNHALRKLAPGAYVRYRSPGNIVEEIKGITAVFPKIKEVYLEVETISANKEWAIELCSKLERFNANLSQPLSFGANLRIAPKADLDGLFTAFKRSNFRFINIGIESGSERIRRKILRRDYSNRDIIETVLLARKHGLKICFFNMIGLPGETTADFWETVKINRICSPNWHFNSFFFPYPGTDLYLLCKKQGLLKEPFDIATEMERRRPVLDLPGFPKKQIHRSYIMFDYYVYTGRKAIYKGLGRVLTAWLRTNYYFYFFYRGLTRLGIFKWLRNILKEY